MRLSVPGVWLACVFVGQAISQESKTEQKHLTVAPLNSARAVTLSADSIDRHPHYPSEIQLKGHVEIRTPVCLPIGKPGEHACDGVMIVRADDAKFHEDTGEIEAHGDVSVTPLQHERAKRA